MGSIAPTFEAALRAVGTAATMAFAGFYLHRRNFVTPSGKKMMVIHKQPGSQSYRTILAMHDSNVRQRHLFFSSKALLSQQVTVSHDSVP